MSWGSKHKSFAISDMIDYAHARGALLIGAAGNSREPESIFPAGYRKVLSVASTEQKTKSNSTNRTSGHLLTSARREM